MEYYFPCIFVSLVLTCYVSLSFESLSKGMRLFAVCVIAAGISLAINTLLLSFFSAEPLYVEAGGVAALIGSGLGVLNAFVLRKKTPAERKRLIATYCIGVGFVIAYQLFSTPNV